MYEYDFLLIANPRQCSVFKLPNQRPRTSPPAPPPPRPDWPARQCTGTPSCRGSGPEDTRFNFNHVGREERETGSAVNSSASKSFKNIKNKSYLPRRILVSYLYMKKINYVFFISIFSHFPMCFSSSPFCVKSMFKNNFCVMSKGGNYKSCKFD